MAEFERPRIDGDATDKQVVGVEIDGAGALDDHSTGASRAADAALIGDPVTEWSGAWRRWRPG